MNSVKDSLITISQSGGAILLSMWEVLPEILRVLILLGTFMHILIKIYKDLK